MPLYHVLPALAAIAFLLGGLASIVRADAARMPGVWLLPAGLSAVLLVWSIWTIALEGPLGFWFEHSRDAWGNQIWFDLLLGVGTAFALLAPHARAKGMRLVPWFLAIACSGSIGMLAMCARYLFLCETGQTTHRTPV